MAETACLTEFNNQSWQWRSLTMSNTQPTIALTGGMEDLNLWMREDGLRIDRLLLVTDTNYIPTGSGPAASSLQLITHTVLPKPTAMSFTIPTMPSTA